MENESIQPQIKPTMETKKSKAPAICSALCIILALAGVGFGVYGMFFNNNNKTTSSDAGTSTPTSDTNGSDKKEITKEAPSTKEIAKVLENKYGVEEFNNSGCGGSAALKLLNGEDLDNKFRMAFIIQKDFYNVQELKYDDCDGMCDYEDISYDDINEKYHLYFGNSNDIEKEDYTGLKIMGIEEAKYIEATDSFRVKYLGGLGCAFVPAGFYVNVASVEADGEEYTALVSAIHLDATDVVSYGARISDCSDDVYNCPILDLDSLVLEESFYDLIFIKEDGEYKIAGIAKR